MRDGVADKTALLPHQAIVATGSFATRGGSEERLLEPAMALREVKVIVAHCPALHPNEAELCAAVRGMAAYGFSWFDAHVLFLCGGPGNWGAAVRALSGPPPVRNGCDSKPIRRAARALTPRIRVPARSAPVTAAKCRLRRIAAIAFVSSVMKAERTPPGRRGRLLRCIVAHGAGCGLRWHRFQVVCEGP